MRWNRLLSDVTEAPALLGPSEKPLNSLKNAKSSSDQAWIFRSLKCDILELISQDSMEVSSPAWPWLLSFFFPVLICIFSPLLHLIIIIAAVSPLAHPLENATPAFSLRLMRTCDKSAWGNFGRSFQSLRCGSERGTLSLPEEFPVCSVLAGLMCRIGLGNGCGQVGSRKGTQIKVFSTFLWKTTSLCSQICSLFFLLSEAKMETFVSFGKEQLCAKI